MKKVLFLINTLNSGGAEKVLVDTVNSLDGDKYDITVQTIIDKGVYKSKLASHIKYKSIVRSKNSLWSFLWTRIILKILGAGFIYRFFVKADYDYEIAFLEGQPTKIISRSTNKNGKKLAWVHTDLSVFPDSSYAYGSEKKEREAYCKFDMVYCVSEIVRNELQKKYGIDEKKLRVVYNIIDDNAIREASEEECDLPELTRPMIVTVGRLVAQKGYDRLLRVHHRLIGEGLKHTLLIIGDGPQREMLSDYIRDNDLSETALLLGYQSNPHKYVSKADLFICSSIAEGYSTAVSEAVLCGIPVVSTNVAGAYEPFDSPRCSVIIDNHEDAIYRTMKDFLENPEKLEALREGIDNKSSLLTKCHLLSEFERNVFM